MNYESLLLAQINAFYGWLLEEGHAPHIVVDNRYPGVEIPAYLMASKHTVLNVSMTATEQLMFREAGITFNARFNGRAARCVIPLRAVAGFLVKRVVDGKSMPMTLPMLQVPESDTAEPVDANKGATKGPVRMAALMGDTITEGQLNAEANTDQAVTHTPAHGGHPSPSTATDRGPTVPGITVDPPQGDATILPFGPRKKK